MLEQAIEQQQQNQWCTT